MTGGGGERWEGSGEGCECDKGRGGGGERWEG